jgi:hypothetical protein
MISDRLSRFWSHNLTLWMIYVPLPMAGFHRPITFELFKRRTRHESQPLTQQGLLTKLNSDISPTDLSIKLTEKSSFELLLVRQTLFIDIHMRFPS